MKRKLISIFFNDLPFKVRGYVILLQQQQQQSALERTERHKMHISDVVTVF